MDGIRISIVIPTVGRSRKLARTLEGFEALAPDSPPFEVVVALDGEDAASRPVAAQRPYPVTVTSQERAGTGAARNLGARAARGDLLLFLNDDTWPHPDLLAEHHRFQERRGPCLALGRVEWDPQREVTPYMRWLAPAGRQFNYERLVPGQEADWTACWGTNLAVPRDLFLDEPYDESLRVAALEDVELGYRQLRRGRRLLYLPTALCYHDHRYEGPRDYRRRARTAGAAARLVVHRHPELVGPLLLRPLAAAFVESLSSLRGRLRRRDLWNLDYRWHYAAGVLTVYRDGAL